MTNRTTYSAAVLIGAATLALSGCSFSKTITLHNLSGHDLRPYPVVTEPPPPHRQANPAGDVPSGASAGIDPHGFNPVFYAAGITETSQANGLYVGLQMEDEPYHVLFRTFHYRVPPGEEGGDPTLQPVLLHEGLAEVENVDVIIRVSVPSDIGSSPPGGWGVAIEPGP